MSHRSTGVFYHATPRRNLASVLSLGLWPRLSRGRRKCIWLCTASKRDWAIVHVARHHNVAVSDMVLLRVTVSRSQLSRYRRGIWTTTPPIRPSRIQALQPAAWVS